MRKLLLALVWLMISGCVWAQEKLPEDAIILSFRLKVEIGRRTTEMAPKVAVLDGKSAELEIWSNEGDDEYVKLSATPRILEGKKVNLEHRVKSRLGGQDIERKMRLVTLLGNEATFEVVDAKNKEKLGLTVLPEMAKKN